MTQRHEPDCPMRRAAPAASAQPPDDRHARSRSRWSCRCATRSATWPSRSAASSARTTTASLSWSSPLGPSRDRTAELARAWRLPIRASRWSTIPPAQIAAAINLALGRLQARRVVRVDGHSMLPRWLHQDRASQTLRETGAVNVGGIMAAEGITPFQQAVAWAMTSPFGVGAAKNHTGGEAGPGRHRLHGRLPPGGHRAGRRLQRGVPDRRGLGAEPPHPAGRRSDLVPAGAAGDLPAPRDRSASWASSTSVTAGGAGWLRASTLARSTCATSPRRCGRGLWRPGRSLAWPGCAAWRRARRDLAGTAHYRLRASARLRCRRSLAVAASAARQLPPRAAARLPIALATMHMCWGTGFLTSPRSLVPERLPAPDPTSG